MTATSAELLTELLGRGMTKRAIGRAIGRDSSLLSQVASGRKPGTNLASSLAALRDTLDGAVGATPVAEPRVQAPARRLTAKGTAARVRGRTTVSGRGDAWSVTKLGRAAARGKGAAFGRVLDRASESGQPVAVTLSFGKDARVHGSSGGRNRNADAKGVTLELDDPGDVADQAAARGVSPLLIVLEEAERRGFVTAPNGLADVKGAQVRTY